MPDPTPGDHIVSPPSIAERPFQYDNIRGIFWMLGSVVASSIMTLAVRVASFELDPRMIVLFRFGITALVLIAAAILVKKFRDKLQFNRPIAHLVRGICIGISTHLGFFAIANMELVPVTVLFFMVPVFATVLAGVMNGEYAGPRRWAAVAVSFVGVCLILKPGYQPIEPAVFAALVSSVLFALALILSRRVAQADGSMSALFSSVVITTAITIPLVIPVWELPNASGTWWVIALLVATGYLRLIADLKAYQYGEAGALAPFTYLRLILIGAAAYVMFGEIPDQTAILGAFIIIGSAVYIARREAAIRKRYSTVKTQ